MSILSQLFGGMSRGTGYGQRGYGGYGRSYGGYGRARTSTTQGGFLGSPMGRMAMGSLAAYAARRFFGRRRMY